MSEVMDRFLKKIRVNEESGCWEWTGAFHANGYARFIISGRSFLAHRLSYQLFVADVLDSYVIHHRCHVRHCVNPDHLEMLTIDAHNGTNKTHCRRGHELTEANTLTDKNGNRRCVTCYHDWYINNRDRKMLKVKFAKLLAGFSDAQIDELIKELGIDV